MNVDVIVPLAGMATGIILCLPLVAAAVRFIERRGQGSRRDLDALRQDVQALEERLAALQGASEARLTDVEERIDFAERMLAQRKEPPRLGQHEGV